MPAEDVVHVLRRLLSALLPGRILLDLGVLPPGPRVECGGALVCTLDGRALQANAMAAHAGLDLLVAEGLLSEQAVDDHDVLRHYPDGAALVDDYAGRRNRVYEHTVPLLRATAGPCVVRERCRLRCLRTRHAQAT